MKTYVCLLTGLSCVALSLSALASGADSSAYQSALFTGDSAKFADALHSGGPRMVSVGAGILQQKRALETDYGTTDLKLNHIYGTVGLDLTKWFTVYGGAGQADVTADNSEKRSNFEWLAGGTIRALDYMVLEPWNDIDQYWVGLDLNSYFRNITLDSTRGGMSDNLSELFASVTMSFYSKPEKPGIWDRIGFYVGPAMSALKSGDQSEDQMFGMIGGLQLNPNPNMGLKLELQKFDDVGLGASFTFHF